MGEGTTTTITRQELIKAELSTEHHQLTKSDRELLKFFFGYVGMKGGRGQTRREEDACLFVKNCLFPRKEEEDDNDNNNNGQGLFRLNEVMKYVTKFPSIFPNDEESVKEFLETGGLDLGDRSMCSVIRSFQVSSIIVTIIHASIK